MWLGLSRGFGCSLTRLASAAERLALLTCCCRRRCALLAGPWTPDDILYGPNSTFAKQQLRKFVRVTLGLVNGTAPYT